jgi:hypothetical protein
MPPNFTWCNFIINALHLASGSPGNLNLLAQFLSQLIGHQFSRVDTSGGDVQHEGFENDSNKNCFSSLNFGHLRGVWNECYPICYSSVILGDLKFHQHSLKVCYSSLKCVT